MIALTSEGAPARGKPFSTAKRYAKPKSAAAEIATIPAAKPSSPSTKFTAFIVITTTRTVRN